MVGHTDRTDPGYADPHSNNAVRAGATTGELAEAAWVAAALRAGASYAHGRLAFKLTDAGHGHDDAPAVPPSA